MNKRFFGFVLGVMISSLIFNGISLATALTARTEKIEVKYDNIQVYKDNVLQTLKDAEGKELEPFIYNGTTYVPVRAAAQMAGMRVEWDGPTKSIHLWDKKDPNVTYLVDVRPPHAGNDYEVYKEKDKTFMMGSKVQQKGVILESYDEVANAFFNLNGEFSEVEMTVGLTASHKDYATKFEIYLDEKPVKEIRFVNGDLPVQVKLSTKGALKLELRATPVYKHEIMGTLGLEVGVSDIIVR